MMNIFRLAGDMTHLLSIVVLLLKIRTTKSCAGALRYRVSYSVPRSLHEVFLLFNSVMKVIFLATSMAVVWYMRYHRVVKQTYSREEDTFRHYFLVLASFLLALLIPRVFTVTELVLLQRSSNIDNLTGTYVFLLGAYRALYLVNWIYRFFVELHKVRWIRTAWVSGLVQTALYADFFYYYIKSWKNHEKLKLPA